jgi:hypothetical protein
MEQQAAAAAAAARHARHGARKPLPSKVVTSIVDGLKSVYFHKVGLQRARGRSEGASTVPVSCVCSGDGCCA